MNHNIPQYDFYKHKYGDELLIDVVPLNTIKKYLKEQPVHILTYYDITLITSGEGEFLIDHQANRVKPQEIIFTRPGEIRKWDDKTIQDGFALIFEEEFLLSFFNDPAFLRNLSYFHTERRSSKLSLDKKAYGRISELISEIDKEIKDYQSKDKHLLRALLYEIIINTISEMKGIDLRKALDIYYSSRLSEQILNDSYGIENMDAKYLAEDLIENEPELF